jgi:hypothetical protein
MHLARILPGSSFAVIGNYFGGCHRASVRYACEVATVRLNTDPALATSVDLLSQGWQKAGFRGWQMGSSHACPLLPQSSKLEVSLPRRTHYRIGT